jgi:NADPH-dependent 2,4-dienoyl-CoA reductase/sulfur reductase-like enzyme
MKAAAVAAERGHDVILHEQAKSLRGQTLLAQMLPGRAEFVGIVTNLSRECELARVEVHTSSQFSEVMLAQSDAEIVILATGATPAKPAIEGADQAHVIDAWSVVSDKANVGASVVISNWRCDWIGLGLAEKLASSGCHVRLAANGAVAGEGIHHITRDTWIGTLHKLGVEMIPFTRLFGVDVDTVYLEHTISAQDFVLEDVETVVTVSSNCRVAELQAAIERDGREFHLIGDCLSPRTAEEAVLEGLKVAARL